MASNPLAYAPSHPDTKTLAAPGSGGLYGDSLRRYIIQRAQSLGLDPNAALAVVPHEGGFQGVTGDNGTSFGPYQLHVGGALPAAHVGDARAWANSPAGVDYALGRIKQAIGGLRGPDAVQAIVTRFERPAARYVPGEAAAVRSTYAQLAGGTPTLSQPAPSDPFVAAVQRATRGGDAATAAAPASSGDPFVNALHQAVSGEAPSAPASAAPRRVPPQRPGTSGDPFIAALHEATGLPPAPGAQTNPLTAQMPTPATTGFAPLNGSVPMTTGGRSPYKNLTFAGHTDWQHVNPTLLNRISQALAQRGLTGQVISGYRSNDYSAANGGFRGDPHTKGIAVDVYVNGQPIGKVIPATAWQKLGIRSGDTFTYHGTPDYEHLDLIGYGYR